MEIWSRGVWQLKTVIICTDSFCKAHILAIADLGIVVMLLKMELGREMQSQFPWAGVSQF